MALLYPLILLSLGGLTVSFRDSPQGSEVATATLGAIVFLIGAPTSWVFAFDFIEASRPTVMGVGALSSLPLWYLLGSRLALHADQWGLWLSRYASVCGLWTALTFLLIVLLELAGVV